MQGYLAASPFHLAAAGNLTMYNMAEFQKYIKSAFLIDKKWKRYAVIHRAFSQRISGNLKEPVDLQRRSRLFTLSFITYINAYAKPFRLSDCMNR